jgi:single-strand binding protein
MGVNKVILLGYVGQDPEIRYLERGKCFARLRLATNEYYSNERGETITQTEWHSIVFWDKAAQNIEKFVHKGSQLYIEGKLQNRSYEDAAKVVHYITEVVARNFQLLDRSTHQNSETTIEQQETPSTVQPLSLQDAISDPVQLTEAPLPF